MTQDHSTTPSPHKAGKPELLAPAGDIEAAYAAFQYGADAIYAGLRRFSARADAGNFSPDELGEIIAYAHSASPRRRVFVAVNTLVQNRELSELVDTLAIVAECGADALIVQDLGVAHTARHHFPALRLHASTQMAIHNLAGAMALGRLGFRRVTLARELTLEEIRDIAGNSGIEVEVFIHGALCYSYSGLCLYSTMLRTGSGNRGRCAYPCRDVFEPVSQTDPGRFLFSMKDLAVADCAPELAGAGVACLKIEGRKKSALYVGATTSYYRALLDGKSNAESRLRTEADIKTIFSRPWTKLYLRSRRNPEVVDTDVVGHRGAAIGKIASIMTPHAGPALLRFTTQRRLERHDGLQLDISGGKPFGFSVDALGLKDARTERFQNVFEVPAGSNIAVPLPREYPDLKPGMTIYCSSSQSVKQSYKYDRPRPGLYRFRRPVAITITVDATVVSAAATLKTDPVLRDTVSARTVADGTFDPARKTDGLEVAFRDAFSKLGDTGFVLERLVVENRDGRFVPVSILNKLRRDLVACLEAACASERGQVVASIKAQVQTPAPCSRGAEPAGLQWSIKVAHAHALSGLEDADWKDIAEAVVDISRSPLPSLSAALDRLAATAGRDRIRLALPAITREWELEQLKTKVAELAGAGWSRWEFSNLSGLTHLSGLQGGAADMSSDWSVYVLNRAAAMQVLELGASGFLLSPEDDFSNIGELLAEFGSLATVIVYQDTPLLVSETCPKANSGGCTGGRRACPDSAVEYRSSAREEVMILNHECRTVVVGKQPFNLSRHLEAIRMAGACRVRADFSWKPYGPAQVAGIVRSLRSGSCTIAGTTGNFEGRLV
ncbi:MAG: U32 family peptidase [bacterium]